VLAGRGRHILTIGEMPGVTPEQARRFTDPARRELDMVFQFEHVGLDHGPGGKWEHAHLELPALKRAFERWQDELADTGWNSLYWSNHDQPRPVSRFGDDGEHRTRSATALATVLHLQRGTPFVYQGEELGMTNATFDDIGDFRDIESLNHFAQASVVQRRESVLAGLRRMSRDNARTPMQWDAAPHGGFTNGTPWMRVNPNTATINAEAQRGQPGSVLEFYRELIALRHREPLVVSGRFRLLAPEHPALFAFERAGDGRRLLVLANLGADSIDAAELEREVGEVAGAVLLANHPDPAPGRGLRAWEALVIEQERP
jgi:oligo-1,6-glucosidase